MRKPRYCLHTSTVGVGRTYPQHQEMLAPYDYDAPRSIHNLVPCMVGKGFPDFEPDFNTVVLDRRAKPTDLISSAPIPKCGHLISSRFLELLRRFKLPPHRVYDVPMVHKDKPLQGYVFLLLPHPLSGRRRSGCRGCRTRAAHDRLQRDDFKRPDLRLLCHLDGVDVRWAVHVGAEDDPLVVGRECQIRLQ